MAAYRLRCSLLGHSMDVRAAAVSHAHPDTIITGSRDRTARVWISNDDDTGFSELMSVSNHSNFVSAVCVTPPTPDHPSGVILTGSNDHTICAFTVDSPTCLYRLSGHGATVCALAASQFGTVISGSWDTTAKVWLNQKCVLTLQGHTASVWAVAIFPEQGIMLTGSADKTLRMWKAGVCQRTLTGHTDCVRGLAVLNTTQFLSCSNDGTIRRWTIAGDCLQTYYGHTNFVYSVAALLSGEFVSVGEDRTARLWSDGKCTQTIRLPAQSIWCVAAMNNGDFVVGGSDGAARVFSRDPARYAADGELKAFDEEIAKSTLNAGEIGDLKIDQLPGKEALYEPGKREGQTLMVHDGNIVSAYQWSSKDSQWQKIGDVVGASGSTQSTSGKVLHEGKEYDYVFDVDIEDGQPPLKLPYNITDDPWFAAQTFIHKNNLSQLYLDQVANFIVTNSKGMVLGQTSVVSDPLTGGTRYLPNGNATSSQTSVSSGDPFTGEGRYISSTNSVPIGDTQDQHGSHSRFFPQKSYLTFDSANVAKILEKLKEFNSKTGDGDHKVEDSVLDEVVKLTHPAAECSALQITTLEKLLQWPHDILFPVLDILRLAIKHETLNAHFCNDNNASTFIGFLLQHLVMSNFLANQMLAIRTLCNMMCQPPGQSLALRNWDSIIRHFLRVLPNDNKNVEIAVCSVLLNYAVLLHQQQAALETPDHKLQCVSSIARWVSLVKDGEAQFRLLVCLGTLIHQDENAGTMAKSLDLKLVVGQMKEVKEPAKLGQCAADVELLL